MSLAVIASVMVFAARSQLLLHRRRGVDDAALVALLVVAFHTGASG